MKLGVGPEPVSIASFNAERLRRGIEHTALPAAQRSARDLGRRIRAERGADRMVEVIERLARERRARPS
jgi:hypothetical protein